MKIALVPSVEYLTKASTFIRINLFIALTVLEAMKIMIHANIWSTWSTHTLRQCCGSYSYTQRIVVDYQKKTTHSNLLIIFYSIGYFLVNIFFILDAEMLIWLGTYEQWYQCGPYQCQTKHNRHNCCSNAFRRAWLPFKHLCVGVENSQISITLLWL